ncbi:MAG: CDP-alcohol phosphatidyltransferase family protein [Crocinitomicaceae bacterium]|nr:CDP-alcohol phosphatidyltransferase family protein [Crocinitomicaceae bacterium]
MISIYKIKPKFQQLLQPLLRSLKKMGVTPNQLTITAVFLSIGMGIAFLYYPHYHSLLLVIPFGYLLRMILNALDGMMATQYKMSSKLGEVLNELGDVVSDIVILLPLMIIPHLHPLVIILFTILAVINEYAGILAKVISGKRRYDGPMGKSDRALLIGLFCLVYYFWNDLAIYSNWIFGTGAALIIVSTFSRLKNGLK